MPDYSRSLAGDAPRIPAIARCRPTTGPGIDHAMEVNQVVGLALAGAGLVDIVAAKLLVGPRIHDARQRRMVTGMIFLGGAALTILGGAFLAGWLSF